ncbi:DUF5719 family protein [Cellulomonas soli]|uniref:DUF5719 family protein n=1 Tax=Cellulomonas soli TaxID=931535 RepID=UPI003F879FD0
MTAVWLGRTVRAVSGTVVVTGVAAVVLVGMRADLDAAVVPAGAGGRSVAVAPSPTTLVCPGPVILPETTGTGDAAFESVPVDPITSVTGVSAAVGGDGAAQGAVTVTGLDGTATDVDLPASGGGAFTVEGPAEATVVRAEPGEMSARVAAATSTLVTAGDLRGLTSASCQEPAMESWLVGGSTGLSSTAQLVLVNAGTTPAEVLLQVWGPAGAVDLTGERYLVAPGAQHVVVLGGVADAQRALVARVQATGGQVTAYVQDAALDGFTPAGTDLVVPGAAPADRQVVPGVLVADSQIGDAGAPVLRLLAPGEHATTARVTLLGADGTTTLPGVEDVALAPGEVTDVPLGGLPAGAWTVVVDADEPVVAAAQVARTGVAGELDDVPRVDRAWAASTRSSDDALAAHPAGVTATLSVGAVPDDLEAETPTNATVRLLGQGGEVLVERAVRMDAGTTLALPVAELLGSASGQVSGVEVVGGDDGVALVWSLVLEVANPDGLLVSVVAPVPARTATADLTVREGTRLTLP